MMYVPRNLRIDTIMYLTNDIILEIASTLKELNQISHGFFLPGDGLCVCVCLGCLFFSHFAGWDVQGGMLGIFLFFGKRRTNHKNLPQRIQICPKNPGFAQKKPYSGNGGIETINPTLERALES